MIGQSFINRPENLLLVVEDKVRLLFKNDDLSDVLGLSSKKIPLWAKEATVIAPKTAAFVEITSKGFTHDEVYVPRGLRLEPGKEYFINECITNGENGFVLVANVSHQTIN